MTARKPPALAHAGDNCMRTPPKLATLLLTCLGPNDPALAGDLIEAYREGRSAAWYWAQVLTSIVIGAGRELRVNKWLGIHAVATFFGLQVLLSYAWRFLWFQTMLSTRVQEFTLAIWGPQDPSVNAPYRWISTFAVYPLVILTGWMVAKVHQRQRGAAVMICCVAITAFGTPRLVRLTDDPISLNLYLHVAWMGIMVTGMLFGGLIAGSRNESAKSPVVE